MHTQCTFCAKQVSIEMKRSTLSAANYDALAILAEPQVLNEEILSGICAELQSCISRRQALASLTAILLVRPELAEFLEAELLPGRSDLQSEKQTWQNLALLLLHTVRKNEAAAWLQDTFEVGPPSKSSTECCLYLLDWFPDTIDFDRIENFSAVDAATKELARRQLQFRRDSTFVDVCSTDSPISGIFKGNSRLLIVHNIVYGQGDEIVRVFPLLQGLLDGFPELRVSLLTDRSYLYDHPRVQTLSIHDSTALRKLLQQEWQGILNFFEPYLESCSYNQEAQKLICNYLAKSPAPFQIAARRDLNHFVFESVLIRGVEYADKWCLRKRQLPLNYETCMRLLAYLGLPLRRGEKKPVSGWIAAANPVPGADRYWKALVPESAERQKNRPLAVVNAFGGNNAMKGFQSPNYPQLAKLLSEFAVAGYDLILLSNGESWGDFEQLNRVRQLADEEQRQYIYLLPELDDRQETMRAVKYFAACADLIITVEGWLMHFAYALGKPYRVLMAPYSYNREYIPHGRSANQGSFLSTANRKVRSEFVISENCQSVLLHYPEKSLFNASLNIWGQTAERGLVEKLLFWSKNPDKDIRSWMLNLQSAVDPAFFLDRLLEALDDPNREVRASAAAGLLQSAEALRARMGETWRKRLSAYLLLGEFRFQDLRALGQAAIPALKACLGGDEPEVSRDAAIMLEELNCG